jgi:hypothetical protein
MKFHKTLEHQDSLFDTNDYGWYLFMRDSADELKLHSKIINLNAYQTELYRYRLTELLIDLKVPLSLLPTVVWLNGMEHPMQFTDVSELIIPDISNITKLKKFYDTLNKLPDAK